MATDANLVLQALVTKATTFSGAWLNIPNGTPRRGLKVRVLVNAATSTTTNACTFSVDVSPDNGTTVYAAEFSAVDQALALTTTALNTEVWIPIETSQPYIRLTATISGAGTASVPYQGDIELTRNL